METQRSAAAFNEDALKRLIKKICEILFLLRNATMLNVETIDSTNSAKAFVKKNDTSLRKENKQIITYKASFDTRIRIKVKCNASEHKWIMNLEDKVISEA